MAKYCLKVLEKVAAVVGKAIIMSVITNICTFHNSEREYANKVNDSGISIMVLQSSHFTGICIG
jgi:hypothetical protein